MRVLVDTNILARHSQPDHELHGFAVSALQRLCSDRHELRLVPQVLYEYWGVATRPAQENGLGLTIEEAHERLEGFKRFFPLLRDERRIYEPSLFDHITFTASRRMTLGLSPLCNDTALLISSRSMLTISNGISTSRFWNRKP
jgi:hypothetical protein